MRERSKKTCAELERLNNSCGRRVGNRLLFTHHFYQSIRHFGGVVNAMPCYGITIVLGIPFGGVCSNHTGVDYSFCGHRWHGLFAFRPHDNHDNTYQF